MHLMVALGLLLSLAPLASSPALAGQLFPPANEASCTANTPLFWDKTNGQVVCRAVPRTGGSTPTSSPIILTLGEGGGVLPLGSNVEGQTVSIGGGYPPYTCSASATPPGTWLDANCIAHGVSGGVVGQTYTGTYTATDSRGNTGSRQYWWTVTP